MVIVISGPSGCGKTTLVKRALAQLDFLNFSVSHTTRSRRNSEIHGRDYYFVSENEFNRMIEEGAFVEWARVHDKYYGTSIQEFEKSGDSSALILDVDIQGARQIKAYDPKALLIFIFPPEYNVLKQRLIDRGDVARESINKRLQTAKSEILCYREFDFVIINDVLEKAVEKLLSVIRSPESARKTPEKYLAAVLASFEGAAEENN